MNGYKKIIPKRARFMILKALSFIPDKEMIQLQYYIKLKRKLNLDHPKRYTEKIQWYKLNYRNELMPICADKYMVREYIKEKGLSNILVELYMLLDLKNLQDLKIELLPEKFILKTTNGSGTNIICRDKSSLEMEEMKKKIKMFLKQSSSSAGREWVYSKGEPRIIIEELLEDDSKNDKSISDYKILCFNGKPEYIVLDVDRFSDHRRNIYDLNWNNLHIESDCKCSDVEYKKPDTLEKMIEIAEKLCEDFPAVRVDLYSIKEKVYFGELTFFPWSGYVEYKPDIFDLQMGEKFKLT